MWKIDKFDDGEIWCTVAYPLGSFRCKISRLKYKLNEVFQTELPISNR